MLHRPVRRYMRVIDHDNHPRGHPVIGFSQLPVDALSQMRAVHVGYRNAALRIDESAPRGSGGRAYLAGQSYRLLPRVIAVLRYPGHRRYHGRRHQTHVLGGGRSLSPRYKRDPRHRP
ncbi:MAG: hypothetical protein QF732_04815 [Nitrospinaceae bacterium]|nr:hypothetical protein [Nitrospinaceae bacterium]